jgi:GGDEF domain-containing protein
MLALLAGGTAALGLWRPRPRVGIAFGLAAALVYAGARSAGGGDSSVAGILVGIALLLGTAMLAEASGARDAADDARRRRDKLLIEELSPNDGDSPAIKWEHATRELERELRRAKRYPYPVTMALLAVAQWDALVQERGAHEARQARNELASLVTRRLRATDLLTSRQDGRLALILPHTPIGGATALVESLRQASKHERSLDFHAGLAEFPGDAENVADLLREAETALAFARASDITVATASFVRGQQQ